MAGTSRAPVNVICSVALVRAMGFGGLALGTSIAAIVNAAALVWLLRDRLDGLDGRRLAATSMKVIAAAAAMAAAAVAIERGLERALPGSHLLVRSGRLAASIGAGLIVFAAAARVFRVEELGDAVATIQARTHELMQRSGAAAVEMLDAIKAVKAAGATDEQLQPMYALQKKAQFVPKGGLSNGPPFL